MLGNCFPDWGGGKGVLGVGGMGSEFFYIWPFVKKIN